MNSSFAVYKVIDNNGNTAATVEPTSTSNSIFTTSDGYKYKYMYSLTSAETLNFMSTDFIHVSTDSVSSAAVDGALDTIEVVAGGSSFNTSSGSTISVYLFVVMVVVVLLQSQLVLVQSQLLR